MQKIKIGGKAIKNVIRLTKKIKTTLNTAFSFYFYALLIML